MVYTYQSGYTPVGAFYNWTRRRNIDSRAGNDPRILIMSFRYGVIVFVEFAEGEIGDRNFGRGIVALFCLARTIWKGYQVCLIS